MSTSNYTDVALRLSVLDKRFAVCRLEPDHEIPNWAVEDGFFSVTRTPDELSISCLEQNLPEGSLRESGWCALKLEGPFEFSEIGVLASVAKPLAVAGVSIFAVSTYDTDYVLVKGDQLDPAVDALRSYGHEIVKS